MTPSPPTKLIHKAEPSENDLILASGSEVRATLLRNAGITFAIHVARIDEAAIRDALLAEQAPMIDIAAELAERKARKVSGRFPANKVLGADQIVVLSDTILSKPETPATAVAQLRAMSGQTHTLISAAVVCVDGEPIWRHVGRAQVTLHTLSDEEINAYVARNWDTIQHSAGCYLLEHEGARLIARIEGDYFIILGLPLLELLTWLRVRGDITA